jgi:hypothetical protein
MGIIRIYCSWLDSGFIMGQTLSDIINVCNNLKPDTYDIKKRSNRE